MQPSSCPSSHVPSTATDARACTETRITTDTIAPPASQPTSDTALASSESADQDLESALTGGGPRYESLRDETQDNDSNDPAGLSPNAQTRGFSSSSPWTNLARMASDQSALSDFEPSPINERTGLTTALRPSLPSPQDSQEDLLTGGDRSFNTHLQPPETSASRHRGFHKNPSLASGDSSLHAKSTKSSTPSSRLASMKQILGRASTRVINLTGSSSQSQAPPVPDIASIYSRRSTEEAEHLQQHQHHEERVRASVENPENAAVRISRASLSQNPELAYSQQVPVDPQWTDAPLEGKSLFIFGPDNAFRKKMNRFLNQTWVELFVLLLLVVNLIFLMIMISSPAGNDTVWGAHWTDYGLLAIFVLYTLEISARVIVSGLVFYPKDGDRVRKLFGKKPRTDNLHDTNPTILRKTPGGVKRQTTMAPAIVVEQSEQGIPMQTTTTARATTIIDFAVGRQTTMTQYIPTYLDPLIAYRPQFVATKAQIPFLRHTFNRIDMLAVVCFWIDFILMMMGVQHIYFFKTIAALRTLRLLNITPGSSTILHSLKKSAPLLVNIALFIAFFFVIFSIIGVQAFKGSFSRRCVLATNTTEVLDQFCGGYYNALDPTQKLSYITINGTPSPTSPKGHICSMGYICQDTGVNFHTTVSFDVIYSAMVPVYVLMTGQTWTDMMYRMMDAEYSWSSIYFVLVVLVMNFWILNLFVAVINEMFAKIRDDSANNSAFKSDSSQNKNAILSDSINNFTYNPTTIFSRRRKWLDSLEFVWVAAVVVDLIFQCMPRFNTPPEKLEQYDRIELWFSVAFVADILIRFLVWLPAPKEFFQSKKNLVDLFLAVTTMIIQIPPIHTSHAYVYLTVFQVLRIYRPIIYVERLKALIQRVVGSWIGLLNLIFFITMFLGVVSVMAGILFREIIDPTSTSMNFMDFYVSYLGMYQLFSGENWTDILYSAMSAEIPWGQVIVATVFIIAFYSFANFVLVNMLIAIIMENFDGEAEVAKHAQQILDFAAKSGYPREEERKFVIYLTRYLKPHPKSIGVDDMQSGWILRMRKGLARQFLLGDNELFHGVEKDPLRESSHPKKSHHRRESSIKSVDFGFTPRYGPLNQGEIDDSHFKKVFAGRERGHEDMDSTQEDTKKTKEPFFSTEAFSHRALLVFGPENHFRRFLQRFVTPGRGYRIEGEQENVLLSRPFNLFITLAILACVVVAAITTPVWRLHQSELATADQSVVVRYSDYVFPLIFTVEFLIRVIADGFILTPDAYLKTLWNQIDLFVLLSLYAPLLANLTNSQGTSRFFRSLKALRALRLINQSAYIKGTFHAVLVAGFPQLFDATMLSMTLLVPFAIYGMRMFSGLFFSCNDNSNSINTINDCTGTFQDPGSSMLMPRVWANPHVYSFDNFGASFLILFEIVSQEGWIGVMDTARNVVGLGLQPNQDVSRYNGIFFVLFNLAGGYFVTSLFVAIVIENYTKRTGTAFMTANQRRWMDLKKLLGGIKMSKTKRASPLNPIRSMCHRIASPKRGWFVRFLAVVTVLNGILLATEHVNSGDWEGVKNYLFMAILSVYMMEIFIKVCGLGWNAFRKNKWNVYNSTVSICAMLITIARVCGSSWQPLIQTQKLFLTAILFRLVPQSDSLNQLFMTMAASMGSISSLFGVWLVVFAVYGIMFVEIFGLTSYGPNGSDHVNFRNIGSSVLMMARMSTGEGWNDLMHDFAVERPNCVNEPEDYLLSDCGSTAWAYTLFISFNIISMYIFTNMFIVVVMHNFSYVYQIAPGFSLITREEIRSFKRIWSEVDTQHTGYIQEKDLALFLGKLRGVFDMRIYNEEHSLARLQSRLETLKPNAVKLSARDLEKNNSAAGPNTQRKILLNETGRRSTMKWDDARKEPDASAMFSHSRKPSEPSPPPSANRPPLNSQRPNLAYKMDVDYNLAAFNSAIANMDQVEVRRRRRIYNFLHTEAVMSMEPIPGTEFRTKRRLFHWRTSSLGGAGGRSAAGSSGSGGGGGIAVSGDYEMGEIGGEVQEPQVGVSFQRMLNILAHYKLIEDDQCLSIGDMLRHRQKMDRIHARVTVINVKSILLKMMLRQRFLKHYNEVQRIRSLTDDTASMHGGVGGDHPPPPPSGDGTGSGSTQIPTMARSTYSAGSIAPTGTDSQAQVRFNRGDSQSLSPSTGAGVGSGASVKSELDEPINPEQAGLLINELRSEWRSFISSHDLSLSGTAEGIDLDGTEDPILDDFENVDMNPQGQPRR